MVGFSLSGQGTMLSNTFGLVSDPDEDLQQGGVHLNSQPAFLQEVYKNMMNLPAANMNRTRRRRREHLSFLQKF